MIGLNRVSGLCSGHYIGLCSRRYLQHGSRSCAQNKTGLNCSLKAGIRTTSSKLAPQKLMVRSLTSSKLTEVSEGKELEGFVVQEVSEIPEFCLSAYRLLHQPTGAQYLHIQRDDTNNVFSVGFRTTPNNSTGLPHILEHTTLCGSLRYPCRDPFFKMLNRSLATFMNAMTGPDYTIYPFSTQNIQDYKNLMSVYLDAVFNPQLKESDFRQEGWRLEHENLNDPMSPIIIKGVVFNEMKGVFSENQSLFEQNLLNNILPGHTYSFVSGGDPLVIPNLTYEDLKAFHAHYYSPSNSRFYSYGNFPLVDHLKYVNDKYLSNFKNTLPEDGRNTSVPSERRWSAERHKHICCRPDYMSTDLKKHSTIAISVLCSDITDIQETFELQVLSQLLVHGPNSAFYKTLIEPNIGSAFAPATGYEVQTKDSVFTVGLQGVNPKDFDEVVQLYNETLTNVVKEGFDEKHIEGVLHGIELNIKHQSANFGLGLLFGLTSLWNHDGDLVKAMKVEDQVSILRRSLRENPCHLQDKVVKYMKENTHRLVLTMSPDEDYEVKQAKAEQEVLHTKLAALSQQDKEVLFQQALKLRNEQEKTEDTSILPALHVEDLKKEIDLTPLTDVDILSVPIQVCVQPTNGMTYFRGILNTSELSSELKMLVPLFCEIATKMGTQRHTYQELHQLAQLKTGGLTVTNHIADDTMEMNSYEEGILFSSYCLDRNVKDMFTLWTELFNEGSYSDMKRFETLVREAAVQLISGISDMGHHYAMSSAASVVNPASYRKELSSGLSYVGKMKEISQMSDLSHVLAQMGQISQTVFNKNHLRCAINLNPGTEDAVLKEVEMFLGSLSGRAGLPLLKTKDPNYYLKKLPVRGFHHIHSIPVNFAAKSVSTVYYCHSHFSSLRVMARLITSKFLHPQIREKGGAYGSGLSLSPSGVLNFYSYRDPNSAVTFDIFDQANEWVQQNSFTDEDIEEAKLGVFQTVDAPIPPGSKGMNKFLYGIDDLLLQMHRSALMSVTRQDIIEVAEEYLGQNSQSKCGCALLGPKNEVLHLRKKEIWEFVQQDV
ncbi:presequence protease, mitochondrial [Zootermopsis nevadensis]|nr:presequence protease, mitochondrial [Zootermopsis nevadensis]